MKTVHMKDKKVYGMIDRYVNGVELNARPTLQVKKAYSKSYEGYKA